LKQRLSIWILLASLAACRGGDASPTEPAVAESTGDEAVGAAPADAPTEGEGPPRRELSPEDRALVDLLGDAPRGPIPLHTPRPRLGPERAPVTIVLFSDMQCPYCVRVMATLERVLERYGDEVRLFWAHLPLPMHPQADVAARVSVAVFEAGGNEAFFRFLDELSTDLRDFTDDRIEALAVKAGADPDDVVAAMDEYKYDEAITYDRKVAYALGIQGTPFMLINGRPIAGAQPFEAFVETIDDELRIVRALNEAGVPSGREYETLVRLVFGPEVAAQMRESD
jgi:protein-disulfide isomerase